MTRHHYILCVGQPEVTRHRYINILSDTMPPKLILLLWASDVHDGYLHGNAFYPTQPRLFNVLGSVNLNTGGVCNCSGRGVNLLFASVT